MLEAIAKLAAWLGKPALVLSAVWVLCVLVLVATGYPWFAPARGLVNPYIGWIQLALIASSAFLAVLLISKGLNWSNRKFFHRKQRQARLKHLESLTVDERHILQAYVENGTRTLGWPADDGVVGALINRGILYRHGIGDFRRVPTHVAEDVWLHINEHPELIATPGQPRRVPGANDWMRY